MITPIRNQILFKPFMESGKTDGGLFVPFPTESDRGEIISVGKGTVKQPMNLEPGEIGYRVHGWGEPIIDNGTTYYLMDSKAIIAKE